MHRKVREMVVLWSLDLVARDAENVFLASYRVELFRAFLQWIAWRSCAFSHTGLESPRHSSRSAKSPLDESVPPRITMTLVLGQKEEHLHFSRWRSWGQSTGSSSCGSRCWRTTAPGC
jgi:hypothetical protein